MAAEALSSDMEKMDIQGKLYVRSTCEDPQGINIGSHTLFSSSVSLILSSSYTKVFRTSTRLKYLEWTERCTNTTRYLTSFANAGLVSFLSRS